jgi:DNA-binding CsgD family transcriptional regulator
MPYLLWTSIAARRPLALVVDDADHADVESLAVLQYLVRRLGALPLWVLLGSRPRVPGTVLRPVDHISTDPRVRRMTLTRLGQTSVGSLVAHHFREEPNPSVVDRFQVLSRGNPLMLFSLLATCPFGGDSQSAVLASEVSDSGLPRLAAAIQERLSELPVAAAHLLEAVAVLGDHADLGLATLLARLEPVMAERALDDLIGAELLEGADPLRFGSPLVRAAVYGDIARARRTRLHRAAARLLTEQNAPVEAVFDQLAAASPTGDVVMVDLLQEAGRRALAAGAPALSARCIRRALAEPAPFERRAELLLDQVIAEAASDDSTSVELFRQAVALGGAERDQVVRAAAAIATSFPDARGARDTIDLLRGVATDLGANNSAPFLRIEVASTMTGDPIERTSALSRLERLVADPAIQASREARIARAHILTQRACDPTWSPAIDLIPQLLAALNIEDLASADSLAVRVQAEALEWLLRSGDIDTAEAALRAAQQQAVDNDHWAAAASTSTLLALSQLWQGNLADAEQHARSASAIVAARRWAGRSLVTSVLVESMLLQGHVADARQLSEAEEKAQGAALVSQLETAGRIRVASGEVALALMEFLAAGDEAERLGIRNPAITGWRADAAFAYAFLEQPMAKEMAAENLALARAFGSTIPLGRALRAMAASAELAERVPLLMEAIAILDRSPGRVEFVAALIDLGAVVRRLGDLEDARRFLRRAAHLASGYGAVQLAVEAANELRAAGARPRRLVLTGPGSLTPSERRVATLAAEGHTNAAIARILYVAEKTVEGHLARAFQKLEIDSRSKLSYALNRTPPASSRERIYALAGPRLDATEDVRPTG